MPAAEPPRPDSRLPGWAPVLIVAGGILAYVGVGKFLLGPRFQEIEGLWQDPRAFLNSGGETVFPYVLLFIPAVLGAVFTRDALRVIFRGLRQGDAPLTIAKDVVLYLLGMAFLVLVGLFSSGKKSYH
jgi:hypothetical protein